MATDLGKHVQFTAVYKEALLSRRMTPLRSMISSGQVVGPAKTRQWELHEKSEKYLAMMSADDRRAKEAQSRASKRKAMMDRVLGVGNSCDSKPSSAGQKEDPAVTKLGNAKEIAWEFEGKIDLQTVAVAKVSKHASAIGSGVSRKDIKSILGENNMQDVMGPAKKRALAREKLKTAKSSLDGKEKAFEAINDYQQAKKREKMLKDYGNLQARIHVPQEFLHIHDKKEIDPHSPAGKKAAAAAEREAAAAAEREAAKKGDGKTAKKAKGGFLSRFNFRKKSSAQARGTEIVGANVAAEMPQNVTVATNTGGEEVTVVEKYKMDSGDDGLAEEDRVGENASGTSDTVDETPKKKKVPLLRLIFNLNPPVFRPRAF
jgi:hypothetical protein